MTNEPTILKELAVFQVNLSIWGGDTTLDEPDFKLGSNGEFPPKHLASLGRKSVIDKNHLKPFVALRQQTRRFMESVSMRFMDGYATSFEEVSKVTAYLEEVSKLLDDLKRNLISNYDRWVDEWANDPINDGYKAAILSSKVPLRSVEKAFSFSFQAYQVNPVNEDNAQKLNSMASGLGKDLMCEIVKSSNDFYSKYLNGKDKVSVQTVKTLQTIYNKARSLRFLNGDIQNAITLLDDAISNYQGCVTSVIGNQFRQLMSTVLILCSEDKILQFAAMPSAIDAEVDFDSSDLLDLPDDEELDQYFQAAENVAVVHRVSSRAVSF